MKANYIKPLLTVEMFSTTQTTSRDCVDNIPKDQFNSGDPVNCGWDVGGGLVFFVDGGKACNMNGEGMSGACYNNPSEGNYIFRS